MSIARAGTHCFAALLSHGHDDLLHVGVVLTEPDTRPIGV
jgi:hypothetical protein